MSLVVPVNASDHVLGPADAPVTLVEYGDYQCPYCGEAYPILKEIKEELGDNLRFVFRNFPLTEAHPDAMAAAELAETAATIGRFWEAHDMLYEHQNALGDASLVRYGRAVGLDDAAIEAGLDGRYIDKIRADFMGGVRSGVNGTPTLFINGRRHDGGFDRETLLAALNEAIREAR